MARTKQRDPLSKRRDETDLQWRSRVASYKQNRRDQAEPAVTIEAQRHGEYTEELVPHENGTISRTYRQRTTSALAILKDRGKLTEGQYYAAMAIARIAEAIQRNASIGGASMEARVDCSGSGKDVLVENLHQVRLEGAYSAWRLRLPLPRRMILDMVLEDGKLKAIARSYNKSWPTALKMLTQSLDMWDDCYQRAIRAVDQEDLDAAHSRLTRARKCA